MSPELAEEGRGSLISERSLKLNLLWNAVGCSIPLAVAVVGLPQLIDGYGKDRFGFIVLIWLLIGNMGLADFGMGYALTKFVAELAPRDEIPPRVRALIGTALTLMLGVGLVLAAVLAVLAPVIVRYFKGLPPQLETEATDALRLVSSAAPFVLVNAGLRGLLEARQRFGRVNFVRSCVNVALVLGPLLVLQFKPRLEWVALALVITQVLALVLQAALCWHVMPGSLLQPTWSRTEFRRLFGFGGWMAVSNIVGVPMLFIDRLVITTMVSVGALTFYATPAEIVLRLWLIPMAISGVLFPTFSTVYSRDPRRALSLFQKAQWGVGAIALFVVLSLHFAAARGLGYWLGAETAAQCIGVTRIMLIGVFVGSMSMFSVCLLQAIGRPGRVAKLHLVELPLYLVTLVGLTARYGIEGAAWAWSMRLVIEAFVLLLLLRPVVQGSRPLLGSAAIWMTLGIVLLSVATLTEDALVRVCLFAVAAGALCALARGHDRKREGRVHA